MAFFEAPPPQPEHRAPEPEWMGPAENVLPAPFALWHVLARTDAVAVVAHEGLAYPNGFCFAVSLRRREARQGLDDDPIHAWHRVRATGEIPPEALRLGIELADGSKATVFEAHRWVMAAEPPEGPVLIQRGGSGGMHSWELAFWVWPLPPPGPLALVCEWPSEHIGLTRCELDGAAILAASADAEQLWEEGAGPQGGWAGGGRIG